jgi:hypothetical protein
MTTKLVDRVQPYTTPESAIPCPGCGAPLVAAYREGDVLRFVLDCSGDCGFSRDPRTSSS